MPFISEKAVKLSPSDWVEISAALESKIGAIEGGQYAPEEPGLGSDSAWILHLREILERLGPDGVFAVEDGVVPVPDPDGGR